MSSTSLPTSRVLASTGERWDVVEWLAGGYVEVRSPRDTLKTIPGSEWLDDTRYEEATCD